MEKVFVAFAFSSADNLVVSVTGDYPLVACVFQ
jgi:hypothetical protein